MSVFLGLGSNLGERRQNLARALEKLGQRGIDSKRVSPVVESPAMLPAGAPPEWNLPFLNLVTEVSTDMLPADVLRAIKEIESEFGRAGDARWAPRLIDIDILLWGDDQINQDDLRVPHPGMHERSFVVAPLVALEPRLTIPGLGEKTMLDRSQDLEQHLPLWMGIVNVTPDSFSDGGRYDSWSTAQPYIDEMISAGVHIIDVGGESTRPGAEQLTFEEEWQRIEPVVQQLIERRQNSSLGPLISVDTYHRTTAEKALGLGVDIINDVGGLQAPEMIDLALNSDADWIAMHSLGLPAARDHVLSSERDSFAQVDEWLISKLDAWESAGLDLDRIVFDPGIGFGKNSLQSMQLMARAGEFRRHGLRVLVGHSRKSYLNHLAADEEAKDLLTLGASLNLCRQSIDVIRVHNVPLHTAAFRGWNLTAT
ncbi:MAG: dihydropteroate synthase [Gammaproteobacteria bacterium]